MNEVKAISDKDKLSEMLIYLKFNNNRNYILFLLGLHTGLRIGDILKLKVKDVYKKKEISIREEKTNKKREIAIGKKLSREINSYCNGRDPDEFLIKSKRGNEPIGRCQAYKIINNLAKEYGLTGVGCHSLRKTFGKRHYEKYGNLEELRLIFNHSNADVTRRYIGVEQEIINKHIRELWD